MTDNEIIKALEEALRVADKTINHQKAENEKLQRQFSYLDEECSRLEQSEEEKRAEIERLNVELKAMRAAANGYKAEVEKLHPYKLHYGNLRMEIAREVCDRLKAKGVTAFRGGLVVTGNDIDNLLKEMEKECEDTK